MMAPDTTKSRGAPHHVKKHSFVRYQTLIFGLVLYSEFNGLVKPPADRISAFTVVNGAMGSFRLRQLVTAARHMF
jgi:hypothetical protein